MTRCCDRGDCQLTTCVTVLERRALKTSQGGWQRALYRDKCNGCGRGIGQGALYTQGMHLTMPDPDKAVLQGWLLTIGECCEDRIPA